MGNTPQKNTIHEVNINIILILERHIINLQNQNVYKVDICLSYYIISTFYIFINKKNFAKK